MRCQNGPAHALHTSHHNAQLEQNWKFVLHPTIAVARRRFCHGNILCWLHDVTGVFMGPKTAYLDTLGTVKCIRDVKMYISKFWGVQILGSWLIVTSINWRAYAISNCLPIVLTCITLLHTKNWMHIRKTQPVWPYLCNNGAIHSHFTYLNRKVNLMLTAARETNWYGLMWWPDVRIKWSPRPPVPVLR